VGPNNWRIDVSGVAPEVRVDRVGGIHVAPRQISAKEVVADIRAGATDEFLMKKYGISEKGLQGLFQKLITAKAITQAGLDTRTPGDAPSSHSKQATTGVEGRGITVSDEGSRVCSDGAATGNIEAGRRNSSGQFPVVLSRFPQPGVSSEFSQLFAQITVEEQIEPGIYRYVGISPENPIVEIIGSDHEVRAASLGWGKHVPADMYDALGGFLIGLLMSFCPGLSEDDYTELTHGILDMASDPDNEGYFDKVVGEKRIGLTLENTSCRVTIDDAYLSQERVAADHPEFDHKLQLLNHALSAGAITEAEFNTKKEELERDLAKAHAVRLERAKLQEYFIKLSPLKEALNAGLLTPEQFSNKRKDLIVEFGGDLLPCPVVLKGFPQPQLTNLARCFKQIRREEPIAPNLYRYLALTKWDLSLDALGNEQEIKIGKLMWSVPAKGMVYDTMRAFLWHFVPGIDQADFNELETWAKQFVSISRGWESEPLEWSGLDKVVLITNHYTSCGITVMDIDFCEMLEFL